MTHTHTMSELFLLTFRTVFEENPPVNRQGENYAPEKCILYELNVLNELVKVNQRGESYESAFVSESGESDESVCQ